MDECALVLFKAFLRYADARMDEGLAFKDLLNRFLSEELGMDDESDSRARRSLTRRLYSLARKHVRNPSRHRSLLEYITDD